MARRPSRGPTERELEILQVLWTDGTSSVRAVHEHLSETEGISFTSVQTMLQVMFDQGLTKRELQGRTYLYRAATSQEEAQRTLLADLLDRAFGGSAKALVSRALDVKRATNEELDELQALLDEARRVDDA
jgi:BlaI family transcriptional regulator, penicillinase repressor